MDAVTLLQGKIDVEQLLEHYDFDKVTPDGQYLRACCKIHGGNNPTAFVISKETGLYYCHTGGCGGGDIFTLVQQMEGISFPQAVEWVAKFFSVDISDMEIQERKQEHIKEMNRFIKTMRARKKRELAEFHVHAEIKEVARYQGFLEPTIKHFGMTYVESVTLQNKEGKDFTLKKRLLFPIIQNGIQVGVSFRAIEKNAQPKWLHQPSNLVTGDLLYNYDAAQGQLEIVVVEGMTDVWAYHEIGVVAVATFGAHLTDEQYRMLIRTGADITLSYDADDAGYHARDKAVEMLRLKANLREVKLPAGADPASISREELKTYYGERTRIH